MKAAWYEKQGPAREVLTVGEMPDPAPGPGELRIRIATSGINPGDIRKRQDDFGVGMPYPRVIPHSERTTCEDFKPLKDSSRRQSSCDAVRTSLPTICRPLISALDYIHFGALQRPRRSQYSLFIIQLI